MAQTAVRHATSVAAVVLAVTLAGFAAYVGMERSFGNSADLAEADFVFFACQLLPFGVVGAVLVAKRPDLPFGWVLSVGAVALVAQLALVGPSYWALESGHAVQLAVWGLGFGALGFVPIALEGVVNVRFPSGRPSSRWGQVLDRVLVWGIAIVVVGSVLGDSTQRSIYPDGVPGQASRFVDGTPLVDVGNAVGLGVPLLILLGVVAGISVIVRFLRAAGVERKQLQWRAVGVAGALLLFPLAVTEALPVWVAAVEPLLFVTTLVVPVLRYDLWAIDSLIRRSATYTLTAPGEAVEKTLRAMGEMLRLPYVAVCRSGRVFAAYGEPATVIESWPLVHAGEEVGELVAAPRRGLPTLDASDRQVLAAVAQLIAGSVRAEALTSDLLQARGQLVAAREEERRRLRRDLHDGLGPLLTGLGLNIDAAQSQLVRNPDMVALYLTHAKEASTEVITSLRSLVHGLRPAALDELGFAGAVRQHTERVARDAGLVCHLRVPEELALPAAVEVAAFRTIIEGVTNVARHSRANFVCVEVDLNDSELRVNVADEGRDGTPWQPGVGLIGMRERVEELGGTLRAAPGATGGRVQATFPLEPFTP